MENNPDMSDEEQEQQMLLMSMIEQFAQEVCGPECHCDDCQ